MNQVESKVLSTVRETSTKRKWKNRSGLSSFVKIKKRMPVVMWVTVRCDVYVNEFDVLRVNHTYVYVCMYVCIYIYVCACVKGYF